MRCILWNLFLSGSLGGVLVATAFAAPAPPVYALEECLNLALEKNPTIRAAQWDIESGKGSRIAARAVLYPRVGATASAGMRNEDVFDNLDRSNSDRTREDWRGTVQIVYTLYSGATNPKRLEIADLEMDRRLLQFEQTVNEVVFNVKRSFNQVLFHQDEIGIQRQIIAILEEEITRQTRLYDAGRATRFTIVRAEVRLANQIPQLIAAKNNLLNSRIQLVEAVGINWPEGQEEPPFTIAGRLDCPDVNLEVDDAVREALARRPDPRRIGKEAEIARLNAGIARASNVPRIEAFASGTQRRSEGVGSNFTDSRSDIAFGILGRWNIFDGFEGKGLAQEADARAERLGIERDDLMRRIEFQVRRAMNSLERARRTLDGQEDNVARALESLRLARTSVEAGLASEFEVLQATVDLNVAQNIQLRAKLDYHQALAELERSLFTQRGSLGTPDADAARKELPSFSHRNPVLDAPRDGEGP